jgi:hypothetical protein
VSLIPKWRRTVQLQYLPDSVVNVGEHVLFAPLKAKGVEVGREGAVELWGSGGGLVGAVNG